MRRPPTAADGRRRRARGPRSFRAPCGALHRTPKRWSRCATKPMAAADHPGTRRENALRPARSIIPPTLHDLVPRGSLAGSSAYRLAGRGSTGQACAAGRRTTPARAAPLLSPRGGSASSPCRFPQRAAPSAAHRVVRGRTSHATKVGHGKPGNVAPWETSPGHPDPRLSTRIHTRDRHPGDTGAAAACRRCAAASSRPSETASSYPSRGSTPSTSPSPQAPVASCTSSPPPSASASPPAPAPSTRSSAARITPPSKPRRAR